MVFWRVFAKKQPFEKKQVINFIPTRILSTLCEISNFFVTFYDCPFFSRCCIDLFEISTQTVNGCISLLDADRYVFETRSEDVRTNTFEDAPAAFIKLV